MMSLESHGDSDNWICTQIWHGLRNLWGMALKAKIILRLDLNINLAHVIYNDKNGFPHNEFFDIFF